MEWSSLGQMSTSETISFFWGIHVMKRCGLLSYIYVCGHFQRGENFGIRNYFLKYLLQRSKREQVGEGKRSG